MFKSYIKIYETRHGIIMMLMCMGNSSTYHVKLFPIHINIINWWSSSPVIILAI